MEIRAFAERLLFSDEIDDKLMLPPSLTDHHPAGTFCAPPFPGRPMALRPSKTRRPFPTLSELDDPVRRGWLLHFFANHELLAIELMALALLRFPDAPPAFRRALTQTIADEQRHMRLYAKRMEQMGVAFGEIPVNAFFWDCISSMQSPMDYVTRLSLTFEQANLDYALYWSQQFRTMGDHATAEVLDVVYREEIEHVQIGLYWFKRWADPGRSLWDNYRSRLVLPLSPSRAKGSPFSREAREKVGFSEAWIDALELHSQSKGRPPDVWWFEPNLEGQIAGLTDGKMASKLAAELGHLPLFLASSDDLVLLRRPVPDAFLLRLHRAGFSLPELSQMATPGDLRPLGRTVGGLKPWGWSPQSERVSRGLGLKRSGLGWKPAHRELHSKVWAAERLAELEWPEGTRCSGNDQVGRPVESLADLTDLGPGVQLIKAPWSTSGRQRRKVSAPLSDADLIWAEKSLRTYGRLLIEPHLRRVVDLSVQGEIDPNGVARIRGLTRFLTEPSGQFSGVYLGRWDRGLSAELRRFVHEDGRSPKWVDRALTRAFEHVAGALWASGYYGPVGLDAMIYRDEGGLWLKPIVEVNVRYTMGRIALALGRRVKLSVPAVWRWLPLRGLARGGLDVVTLFTRFQEAFPVQHQHGQIVKGALWTNPVDSRTSLSTCLLVGEETINAFEDLVCKGAFLPSPPVS